MKGIFEITWDEKKGKPAVSFVIQDVQELGLAVKGSKVENHTIEISDEIDSNCDTVGALNTIKEYLESQSIEVMNFSDRLPIK